MRGSSANSLRQLGIDLLGDRAVAGEQRVGVLVEELRVGVQVAHEGGEVAREADLLHHRFHLAAQALDLAQSDRVDLRRAQVGRRRAADLLGVDRGAVGVARERTVGGRPRQIFVGDEGAQAPYRRNDVVGDAAFRPFLQGGPLRPGDVAAEAGERLEERTAVEPGAQLPVELRQDAFENRARRHPAEGHAFAQEGELLIDASRVRGKARQDLLGVALRRRRAGAQQLGQPALEAALRSEREAAKADEALHPQLLLELVDEDVERDLVGRRQAFARDRLGLGQLAPGARVVGGFALARGVEELVAVAVVADEGRPLGVALHRRFPRRIEQRLQLARRDRVDGLGGNAGRAEQREAGGDNAPQALERPMQHASSRADPNPTDGDASTPPPDDPQRAAPASYQRPSAARSASVIWVALLIGISFSTTACW